MSPELSNPSPKVKMLAEGIALAEGFHVANSLPSRIHNPGDLEIGDRGYGVQAAKTVFPDDAAGWNWLFGECSLMLASMQTRHRSKIYTLDETFIQVAQHWTGGDNPATWAQTVSAYCRMQPESTLQEFLNA
jgi:hypothetical protein